MQWFHEYEQRCDENVRKHVFSSQIKVFVTSDKTKQRILEKEIMSLTLL